MVGNTKVYLTFQFPKNHGLTCKYEMGKYGMGKYGKSEFISLFFSKKIKKGHKLLECWISWKLVQFWRRSGCKNWERFFWSQFLSNYCSCNSLFMFLISYKIYLNILSLQSAQKKFKKSCLNVCKWPWTLMKMWRTLMMDNKP